MIEISVCRPECVERYGFVAVRAHFMFNIISVGFCRNQTSGRALSLVVPYSCHRRVGIWEPDTKVYSVILLFTYTV